MSVRDRNRVRITRQIVTQSPFDTILYINNRSDQILVEHENQAQLVSTHEIGDYIRLNQHVTNYEVTASGDIVRFNSGRVEGYTRLNNEIEIIPFSFCVRSSVADEMKKIETEKFFVEYHEDRKRYHLICHLPLLPTYVSYKRTTDRQLNMSEIFHIYKGQLYQFPYGNVSGNRLCAGHGNASSRTVRGLYINLINAPFNFDYYPVMDCWMDKDIYEHKELTELHKGLYNRNPIKFNIWNVLYYLSNIEDFNNFNFDMLFKLCPPEDYRNIRRLLNEANPTN